MERGHFESNGCQMWLLITEMNLLVLSVVERRIGRGILRHKGGMLEDRALKMLFNTHLNCPKG